ncbi:MAG TPA: hypothetical protein VFU20_06950 [Sphingomicrobium sp.]|nr:hypothetical protein [Sphingomicrobium sp.]
MSPFSGMAGLTKNPLGILAIFLGVLYGIAGMLLGARADALTDWNETILTLLIFLFPFVSLGVFGWLVSRHHANLYAPSDFRSDSGFLASAKKASQKEIDKKIEQEATVIDGGELAGVSVEGKLIQGPATADTHSKQQASTASDRRAVVRQAESQVLDLLEADFDKLRKDVKFDTLSGRPVLIDAIGLKDDQFTLVEVITVRLRSTFETRVRDLALNLLSIEPSVRDARKTQVLVCVVWLEGQPNLIDQAIRRAKSIFKRVGLERVAVRQFVLSDDGIVQSLDS